MLITLLLRFDRLRCLVQGATEYGQHKQLLDEIKADAKELGQQCAEAEESETL